MLKGSEYDLFSRATLCAELDRIVGREAEIDFAGVRYVDASALGCLVRLHNRLRDRFRATPRIRLRNASRHIVRILDLCGFERLFSYGAEHDS
ncbi:MAG: STAS domain-containing protein [Candidatus Eremiobacteraeota bacterium]|nr:STAS domain-containing protein [Candidatus Eremiobacteraeota bacterium]